jgi:hypothetical protein
MLCGQEVRSDIAAAFSGLHETRLTTPAWTDRLYCTFVYPKGALRLSVKELASAPTTTAHFTGLAQRLGRAQVLRGLGQGAFIAKNDDVVARKEDQVSLVDVQHIPAGRNVCLPMMRRSDVALNVAVAIMGCWVAS